MLPIRDGSVFTNLVNLGRSRTRLSIKKKYIFKYILSFLTILDVIFLEHGLFRSFFLPTFMRCTPSVQNRKWYNFRLSSQD